LGETALSSGVSYKVTKEDIRIHAEWSPNNFRNDISLIKIPSVTFTDKIQPIRLPQISTSYSSYSGSIATTTGWCRTSATASGVINKLQYGDLTIISNVQCAAALGTSIVGSDQICAETPNCISTCNTDTGGPLVEKSEGVLIGLAIFRAAAGCEKGIPFGFTRITSNLDWIYATTGIA